MCRGGLSPGRGIRKLPGKALDSFLSLPLGLASGAGQLSEISPSMQGWQDTQEVIPPTLSTPHRSAISHPHLSVNYFSYISGPINTFKGRAFS